ncbi:MAG: hypothetical protein JO257_23415 [Deltaproteobacteria bacterium]|nr:hypothetical protein [Deltaproteobacteria bacterium]
MLAALATGIEAGNDDAARAAVGRGDWILRGAARRRLERALIDAALQSRELVTAADPEAMRHIQRVAALDVAGVSALGARESQAACAEEGAGEVVDARDRAAVARAYKRLATRPPTVPVATASACVMLAMLCALFAFTFYRLRHPARHHASGAPYVGAFATGGTPLYDLDLEQMLAIEMPRIAWLGGEAPAWLRDAMNKRAPLVAPWHAFLDAAADRSKKKGVKMRAAAHALSNALAGENLGYQVAAYDVDNRAVVFVYRVDQVVFVRCDGEPRRVLDLRRIDHVQLERFVLGLESSDVGDPVVMLDRVEEFVATHVRPVAQGAAYELGDDTFRRSTAGARLASAAGTAIRGELAEPIEKKATVGELFAASVRRHEARHSIDVEHDLELPTPPALERIVGEGPFAVRARAELAAYLTQIAYDPALPQLALWNFANQAFDSDYSYGAEGVAAVVALEGLARHVGGGVRPPAMLHGRLDRGTLAETALPLAQVSDDQLRTAARELFEELFGERPVAIYDSRR